MKTLLLAIAALGIAGISLAQAAVKNVVLADVAAARIVLDRSGPCVLVGHSWGGMTITEAAVHPSVRSLVYVNAFQPAVGDQSRPRAIHEQQVQV